MTMIVDEALNLQLQHIAEGARKAVAATDVIIIVVDDTQQVMGVSSTVQAGTPKEIKDAQVRLLYELLNSAQAFTQKITGGKLSLQMITPNGDTIPIKQQAIHGYKMRTG